MADTLKDFLISVGFKVDEASQGRAEKQVRSTEESITGLTEKEHARRAKVEDEAQRRVEKRQIERDKKDRARRTDGMKDLTKSVQQFEVMASRVQTAVSAASMAFVDTKLLTGVKQAADAYSRLAIQSQRTGAAPAKIGALMYGLGQLGVDRGTAESSFERFNAAIKDQPGLKNRLEAGGVHFKDAKGNDLDRADVFAQLGTYFRRLPQNVARAQASSMGLDVDTLLPVLTKQQAALAGKIGEFGKIQGGFGLDPGKASEDGRKFAAAYDKLAADLLTIKDRIAAEFFGPLTELMKKLSAVMEAHPDATVKFGEGFVALAALLSLKVIPKLAKLSGLLTGLSTITPPLWLLRLLGLPAAVAVAGGAGVAALQALPQEQKEQIIDRHEALQEKQKHHFGGWGWMNWLKEKTGYGAPTGKDAIWARSRNGRRTLKAADGEWNGGDQAKPQAPSQPGVYRPQYKLSDADLSDAVVNTIAGEARNNQEGTDAVINNMMNRVGTHTYGPSANLQQVARAPGQYTGWRVPSAQQAAFIRARIRAIATGGVPDNTKGSNEYRADWYHGPWGWKHPEGVNVGGNVFAYNQKGGRGPYGPYEHPRLPQAKPLTNAPNPYGTLGHYDFTPGQPQDFKGSGYKALGLGANGQPVRLGSSVTNSTTRGDTHLTHNPTFNISGHDPVQTLEAARRAAGRGTKDLLRNMQGAEQ